MPTTLSTPDKGAEIYRIAAAVIDKKGSLKDMREAGVTYDFLFAHNSEGPAVKLHGYPCAATIKINSYEKRVEGHADCVVKVDAHEWGRMDLVEREALLFHEFLHLVVVKDKEKDKKTGAVTIHGPKTDDLGRPKLKMNLHDFQVGIFKEVIEDYGQKSLDAKQIAPLVQWAQGELDFEAFKVG